MNIVDTQNTVHHILYKHRDHKHACCTNMLYIPLPLWCRSDFENDFCNRSNTVHFLNVTGCTKSKQNTLCQTIFWPFRRTTNEDAWLVSHFQKTRTNKYYFLSSLMSTVCIIAYFDVFGKASCIHTLFCRLNRTHFLVPTFRFFFNYRQISWYELMI